MDSIYDGISACPDCGRTDISLGYSPPKNARSARPSEVGIILSHPHKGAECSGVGKRPIIISSPKK